MKNLTIRTLQILAIVASIFLFFSSCSVIKSVNKKKTEDSQKTELDSLVKSDTETKTKITELADTTVKTAASEIEGSRPVKDLEKKPLVLEDDSQVITAYVDSTGNLKIKGKVKPQSIPIKFKKITEIKSENKTTASVKKKEEVKSETKTTDKDVKRIGLPWWIWLLLIMVILAGIGWKVFKSYTKI